MFSRRYVPHLCAWFLKHQKSVSEPWKGAENGTSARSKCSELPWRECVIVSIEETEVLLIERVLAHKYWFSL